MSYTKKPPTKNQQIMEQIEASITADKLKKKKEPVSKIASLYRNVQKPKIVENTETPTPRFFGSSANSMAGKANFTSSLPMIASNPKTKTFKEWIAARNIKKLSIIQPQVQKQICDLHQNDLKVKAELIGDRERFEDEISELKMDHGIREKRLTDENNCLKLDLELKMEELLEVRKQNKLLDDTVSSIPQKDAKIQKLSRRNVNLSSDLCYERNISKTLLENLNTAQREFYTLKLANDALLQENEVLRYHLAEQSSSTSLLYLTGNQFPSCGLSERKSYSSIYRSSVTPPRSGNTLKAKSSAPLMFRTTFMSEGRGRTLKKPTKIFMPEGVAEVNDSSNDGRRMSRRIDLQNDASPEAGQVGRG